MIARLWHGAVLAKQGDAYMRYLEETGIPDSRATPGNRGVYVLRRQEGDAAHFLFVSLWESREAIRAFAGEDIELARYYPEDREFLLELEPTVTHYEVAAAPQTWTATPPGDASGPRVS
jgi:heme-degrading monooxygenase HmoA